MCTYIYRYIAHTYTHICIHTPIYWYTYKCIYVHYVHTVCVYSVCISYVHTHPILYVPWSCYLGQTWLSSSIMITVDICCANLTRVATLLVMAPAMLIKKGRRKTEKAILFSTYAALGRGWVGVGNH